MHALIHLYQQHQAYIRRLPQAYLWQEELKNAARNWDIHNVLPSNFFNTYSDIPFYEAFNDPPFPNISRKWQYPNVQLQDPHFDIHTYIRNSLEVANSHTQVTVYSRGETGSRKKQSFECGVSSRTVQVDGEQTSKWRKSQ